MSLLRDIQSAAVDPTVDMGTVLRKTKVLASRLRYDALKKWVDQELNGYSNRADLPDYRIIKVESFGNFIGAFGKQYRNAPIPLSCFPKQLAQAREFAATVYLAQGVGAYIDLLRQNESEGSLQVLWPAEMTSRMADKIYQGMVCMQAWQAVPRSALVDLVEAVRNRVLDFVLELEEKDPEAGDEINPPSKLPNEVLSQMFTTIILGGSNNLAVAGATAQQIQYNAITQGDLASLKSYLASQGLSNEDLEELESAIGDDQAIPAAQRESHPGPKVSAWIGKMAGKAVSGAWSIGVPIATEILTRSVKQYLGLPP